MEYEFGKLIKRERKNQGLTLKQLAERLAGHTTPSYINRLESGDKTTPSFHVVADLSIALGLNFQEVLLSLGYPNLISSHSFTNSGDLEEVIRLNTINHPLSKKVHRKNLSNYEKEMIIHLIVELFKYAYSNEEEDENLIDLMKIIQDFKKQGHELIRGLDIIKLESPEGEYSVSINQEIIQEKDEYEKWKVHLIKELSNNIEFLNEHNIVSFSIKIDGRHWLFEKKGSGIRMIEEQTRIIRL